ncbi:pectinesterase family protein [Anditalea andensis]|uniref:Pectinesterase n=1 Tax=Anditalea andensis TaxID=1048983 RepID=A0A074KRS9_9BACT|nr:pectinesterase family protein [Anditalea andensis]KEO72646.1 pectin esterase [Anditalea andensis]
MILARFYIMLLFVFLAANDLSAQDKKNSLPKELKGKLERDIVVAKDGTGDFTTIQHAIDAIRVYLPKPITVYIKEGVYKEKIHIPGTITNVTFLGEGPDKTVLTYDDHAGKNGMQTFETYTLMVLGSGLVFKGLTIQNTAGPVGQAVALHAEGDRLVFKNCHFKGDQDTMFASGENSKQYYNNCYIEGTTDFIFGSATAYFDKCEIKSKSNSYITAASTPAWVDGGFVFDNCRLTADEGVNQVYLGRPWRDFARTVFMNSEMGPHIRPEGWHDWNRSGVTETAFYAEYNNSGPGAVTGQRVEWSYTLSEEKAIEFSKVNILGRDAKNLLGQVWYDYERDTSYTFYSAYQKAKKKIPHISPAEVDFRGKTDMDVEYKNLGYRTLKMDIYRPENAKAAPGVLLVHGGGWKSGDRSLQAPLAKALASRGYVAAVVEYRLSLEEPYPAAVFDLKDAIKWFKANADTFGLDTTMVAISGSSAGGQLAHLVAYTSGDKEYEEASHLKTSGTVQAVINMDGISVFYHPESKEGEMAALWLGGTYYEVPEKWIAASPLYQINGSAVPVLFINSQYPRFHAGRDDMMALLDNQGVYAEVHTFDPSPHTFWLFNPWFEPTLELMVSFLEKVFAQ